MGYGKQNTIVMKAGRVLNGVTLPDGSRVDISQAGVICVTLILTLLRSVSCLKISRGASINISAIISSTRFYAIFRRFRAPLIFRVAGCSTCPLVWEGVKAGLCVSCGNVALNSGPRREKKCGRTFRRCLSYPLGRTFVSLVHRYRVLSSSRFTHCL